MTLMKANTFRISECKITNIFLILQEFSTFASNYFTYLNKNYYLCNP